MLTRPHCAQLCFLPLHHHNHNLSAPRISFKTDPIQEHTEHHHPQTFPTSNTIHEPCSTSNINHNSAQEVIILKTNKNHYLHTSFNQSRTIIQSQSTLHKVSTEHALKQVHQNKTTSLPHRQTYPTHPRPKQTRCLPWRLESTFSVSEPCSGS